MKKIISAATISFCVLGAFGSASAATFNPYTLTQVIYQEVGQTSFGTVELGTSLVDALTFDFSTASDYLAAPVGNIALPTGLDWSALRLGFYADSFSSSNPAASKFYFATTSTTAPGFSSAMINSFNGSASAVAGLYEGISSANGGAQTVQVDPSQELNSYDNKMNSKSAAAGQYGGLNSDLAQGEANLGLLNTQDHVDMYLYEIARVGAAWKLVNGATNDYVATLRFNLDGSTVINAVDAPAAVPAPASMLLLGSGLLGLVGLRRKKN